MVDAELSAEATTDPALQRLIEQVRQARSEARWLSIRGGGTKNWLNPGEMGDPLETGALGGISSYEPSELVVTVRAGTPLAELEAALAEKGQCLPFEPPRFGEACTVGGMVAAGLSGPARAAVGGVRDFVLGATLLNGRAELLSFGGQVMKNVAGYDVSRLLAGSMGVLGLICEVSLKVLPRPVARATLRFDLDQAQALQRLNTWAGQPLPLNASAWWRGVLVVRLCGARAAVDAAARELGGEAVEPALADAFWSGLRDQQDEFFRGALQALDDGQSLWRLSVPSVAPPLALDGDTLVEWGGAQRWVISDAPPAVLHEVAAAASGHARCWRSRDAAAQQVQPLPQPLARIHRQLKAAFDPDRVFNRGHLLPGL